MIEIHLSRGKSTLIDDADFAKISAHKWYCSNYGYAVRTVRNKDSSRTMMWLHRLIVNCPDGMEVDHINGDRLDNRKINLRICSRASNCKNIKKPITNTSGYKGVSFDKRRGKFRAYINVNGINKHLGYFSNALDAAKSYNKASVKEHGEFARLNPLELVDEK